MDESRDATPWWGKAQTIVWSLGPVTVAFFLLLGVGLGWFPSQILENMSEANVTLQRNYKLTSDIRDDLATHNREVRESQTSLLKALRQICRNTAKTAQQNERCDDM